ncbi:MAG: DUF1826 domain-containing protein [Pseudomonadota bacterium]
MSRAQHAVAQAENAPPPNRAARLGLTLIKRPLADGFVDWLGALPPDAWPDSRFLVELRHLRAGLGALFDECETPRGPHASWWIDDIVFLADQFATRAGADVIDVRLNRILDDACRRFHVDNVQLRLVTTYFGPGTEIVPDAFGPDARKLQREYAGPIDRLGAEDIAIFKGGPDGVVHRSPPIANSGVSRSMLCLNTPSITSPDLWTPDEDG